MLETTSLATSLLPADRLRYFMGIGDPEGLIEVIARGVDMFDCVLPTRTARMGTAFTRTGRINLRNAEHALSTEPLDPDCPCAGLLAVLPRGHHGISSCRRRSSGSSCLTEHNLTFLTRLVEEARRAIMEGRFAAFRSGLDAGFLVR